MKLICAILLLVGLTFSKPQIQIEDAWVRAVPPVSKMSAAFLKIRNSGDEEDLLVGVRTSVSRVAEVHTTVMERGVMKMRRLESVRIPAGETVEFKPMGKHIMLIDLKRPLRPGDRVKLILVFKKSGEIGVEATVRRVNMMH